MFNRPLRFLTIAITAALLSAYGNDDRDVVNTNNTKAADNFEIDRRIVFYNGITNQYLLSIEGKCSIDTSSSGRTLHVICKTGSSQYKKHFLGLSDNVTFFAEQLEAVKASAYHYRVTFKPQQIIPDINFRGSTDAIVDLVK